MFFNRFSRASLLASLLGVAAGLGAGTVQAKQPVHHGRKQWLIDRAETIQKRKADAQEWNKKNYYGKVLTRTGRPIL